MKTKIKEFNLKKKNITKILIALIGMVIFFPLVFSADYYCSSCIQCSEFFQDVLASGDRLFVTADISESEEHCIDFNGTSNIILDCQGHQINGVIYYYYDHSGIEMPLTSGNTIRNCRINSFYYGINNDYSNSNRFENITITNSMQGFRMADAQNTVIIDSNISNNVETDLIYGVYCSNSIINTLTTGNTMIGFVSQTSTIENQNYNSLFLCGANNSLLRNVIVENGDGLRILKSDGVHLDSVTVRNTNEFYIGNSNNIIAENVIAFANGLKSLVLTGVKNFYGTLLTIGASDDIGIQISTSDEIEITESTITGNEYGMTLQSSNVSLYKVSVESTIENYSVDSYSNLFIRECAVDADCDNGIFCDGQETCVNTVCTSNPLIIDDNIACTIDWCDEDSQTIMHTPNHSFCDNGIFCDGVESCDLVLGCISGTPVECDDGDPNTINFCDEENKSCVFTPISNGNETNGENNETNQNDTSNGTPDTGSGSSGGSSGGGVSGGRGSSTVGSGGVGSVTILPEDDFSYNIRNALKGEEISLFVDNKELKILNLNIKLKNQVSNSRVSVNSIEKNSIETPLSENVISYFEIKLSDNAESNVEKIEITFRLERFFEEYEIKLHYYEKGKWIAVKTKKISSDSEYAYYTATTEDFSKMALSFTEKTQDAKSSVITGKAALSDDMPQNPISIYIKNLLLITTVIIVITLVIVLRMNKTMKKKKALQDFKNYAHAEQWAIVGF